MARASQGERAGAASSVARRAALRRGTGDVLVAAGRACAVGAALGTLGVVAERVLGLGELGGLGVLSWWAGVGVVLVPATGLGVIAGVRAWRGRASEVDAAIGADRALGLEDRFASAVSLACGGAGELERLRDPFVRAAIEAGERAASDADIRRAVPMRFGRGWTWALAATGVGVSASLWLPDLGLVSRELRAERQARLEAVSSEQALTEEAARAIASVRESLQDDASAESDDTDRVTGASPEQIEALRRIEEQLAGGAINPSTARREAASVLERGAQDSERERQIAALEGDALRERLAQASRRRGGEEASGSRSELGAALRDALARGDLDAAADAAERLSDSADGLSAQQREELDGEMRRLADQLRADQPREQNAPDGALRALGLSDSTIDDVLSAPDAQERLRRIESSGLSPQDAQRASEAVEQARLRDEARDRADTTARDLGDSLESAADSLRGSGAGSDDGAGDGARRRATPPLPGDQSPPTSPTDAADAGDATDEGSPGGGENAGGDAGQSERPPRQPRGEGSAPSATDRPTSPGAESGPERRPTPDPGGAPAPQGPREPGARDGSGDGAREGPREGPQREGGESGGPRQIGDAPRVEGAGPESEPVQRERPGDAGDPRDRGASGRRSPEGGSAPTPGAGGSAAEREQSQGETNRGGQNGGEQNGATQNEGARSQSTGTDRPSSTGTPPGASGERLTGHGGTPGQEPGPNERQREPTGTNADDAGARPDSGGPAPGAIGERSSGGAAADGADPGSSPGVDPSAASDGERGATPGGQRGTPGPGSAGDGPAGGDEGLQGLAERLRELGQRSRDARDGARDAERLRERARELLEGASEDELRRIRELAERMREPGDPSEPGDGVVGRGDGNDPRAGLAQGDRASGSDTTPPEDTPLDTSRTETVDARSPRDADARRERVVAEWLGEGAVGEGVTRGDGGGDVVGSAASAERVLRDAQRTAERAIEDRVVPARYDRFVREYFRRLPDRVLPKGAGDGAGASGGGGDGTPSGGAGSNEPGRGG